MNQLQQLLTWAHMADGMADASHDEVGYHSEADNDFWRYDAQSWDELADKLIHEAAQINPIVLTLPPPRPLGDA